MKPRIIVCGVGGAGGNAVNNMIVSGLSGVDFIVANTDAQALTSSRAERIIQMGLQVTEGLGAGSKPEVGKAAAEEALEEIRDHLAGSHMVFVTAGMGGGTGTGAAPVIARAAREMGILTVGVVTKPFHFEGGRRMKIAEQGIGDLHKAVDTLIIIPNQNLFRVANEKTTFADAFAMADQVLYSGVACITDLMVKEGLINLDFADVRSIMSEMGKAMMGTGEATGEKRAVLAAEAAIANPLLDETSMKGARGLLISITGGNDLTLYEVDEAASRIRQEVDEEANIILGADIRFGPRRRGEGLRGRNRHRSGDDLADRTRRICAQGRNRAAHARANARSRPPAARALRNDPAGPGRQRRRAPAGRSRRSRLPRADRSSARARGGTDSLHSASAGAARGARAAHAADRGPAAGGAESASLDARARSAGFRPRAATTLVAGEAGRVRDRAPRRRAGGSQSNDQPGRAAGCGALAARAGDARRFQSVSVSTATATATGLGRRARPTRSACSSSSGH